MKRFYQVDFVKLLFRNINYKQTILKNTFWITLAQGLAGVGNFLLAVIVIRRFGDVKYGEFIFAFSLVSLLSVFFDFGLSTAVTREFARNQYEDRHFSSLLTLKLFLGFLVLLVILGASLLVTQDKLVRKITLILGFYIFTLELLNLFYAVFRAKQKMEIEAFFRISNIFVLIGAVLSVIYLRSSIVSLSYAYVGANFATLVIILFTFILGNKIKLSFRPAFNLPIWKEYLLIGWYVALAKGVGDVTMYIDSVMMGYQDQIAETGWYNAAVRINRLILFPMAMIATAVFPALITALKESKEKFIKLWKLWNKVNIFLAAILSSIVFINADKIIETLYTPSFKPAGTTLKILVFMALITYIHVLYYHILLIFDQQKKIFFVVLVGALINVVLNLILIPRFSLYGASIATVITHLAILLQYWRLTPKETFIKPFDAEFIFVLSISIISGISMCLIVSVSKFVETNLFLSISYSALIFSLLFAGLHRIGTKLRFLST